MTATQPPISTHLGYFGTGADRYNPAGYRRADAALERLRLVAPTPGLRGVELNYPALVNEQNVDAVRAVLAETGLQVANVSLNVWGEGKWGLGSLSAPDASVRAEALAVMQRGMAITRRLGGKLVSLWPAQDGFDYPFQVQYGRQMDWFIGGLREAAAFDPDVRLCIEYKPKEPRAHLLADSAARTLWLIGKVGAPNLGVLLDVGHAFNAYENAAQSAVLLQREGVLDLVHFNDNDGAWDWDMVPGTVRWWENLELAFWLREMGYAGWWSIDIVMPRGDPVAACRASVGSIRRLWEWAGRLDREALLAGMDGSGQPANLERVMEAVLGERGH